MLLTLSEFIYRQFSLACTLKRLFALMVAQDPPSESSILTLEWQYRLIMVLPELTTIYFSRDSLDTATMIHPPALIR